MDARFSPLLPRQLRVVICPWLAFGHMLPYLELAERLVSRGHCVFYVSTPRNLARLPPRRHGDAIELVALPRVEGLPDGAGSTNGVPDDERESQFMAAACADEARRPDWVIADTFHHWAAAAAAMQHEVPCAMLLPTAAMIAAIACGASDREELAAASVFEQLAAIQEPPAAMHRYEWEGNAALLTPLDASSGLSVAQRCSLTLERCTITAMRSCPEWELEAFPLAAKLLGKPLVPLGLLPPSLDGGRGAGMNWEDAAVRWLDEQPPKSVVYVALGSEVPLPLELVHELALGLELAGTRFLWALRKPAGVPDADVLPAGFQQRTHNHGLVAMGWVPQISVLAHGAMGAFLTHCGWNSLIEGLLFGHPLIMLPIFGDQGPNAREMEGRKVGLQVARDEDDGSFNSQGVAAAVRAVMVEGEARNVFVENALKMQEIVADRERHERYIDEFIQQLRSYTADGGQSTA